MTTVTVSATINAPIDFVFQTVSDIRNFSEAISCIQDYKILTEGEYGVGTCFRETRLQGKKPMTHELTITEFVQNERVRIASVMQDTTWDSTWTFESVNGATKTTLKMDAITDKIFPNFMYSLMKGMIRKGIQKDMSHLKAYCEGKEH